MLQLTHYVNTRDQILWLLGSTLVTGISFEDFRIRLRAAKVCDLAIFALNFLPVEASCSRLAFSQDFGGGRNDQEDRQNGNGQKSADEGHQITRGVLAASQPPEP
jgi:hypothetical protein